MAREEILNAEFLIDEMYWDKVGWKIENGLPVLDWQQDENASDNETNA